MREGSDGGGRCHWHHMSLPGRWHRGPRSSLPAAPNLGVPPGCSRCHQWGRVCPQNVAVTAPRPPTGAGGSWGGPEAPHGGGFRAELLWEPRGWARRKAGSVASRRRWLRPLSRWVTGSSMCRWPPGTCLVLDFGPPASTGPPAGHGQHGLTCPRGRSERQDPRRELRSSSLGTRLPPGHCRGWPPPCCPREPCGDRGMHFLSLPPLHPQHPLHPRASPRQQQGTGRSQGTGGIGGGGGGVFVFH